MPFFKGSVDFGKPRCSLVFVASSAILNRDGISFLGPLVAHFSRRPGHDRSSARFVCRLCVTYISNGCLGPVTGNWLGMPEPLCQGAWDRLCCMAAARLMTKCSKVYSVSRWQEARIVFVPSAGFRRGWYDSDEQMIADLAHRYRHGRRSLNRKQVESFQFLFTDDPDDADDPQFTKPLKLPRAFGSQAVINCD